MKQHLIVIAVGFAIGYALKNQLASKPLFSSAYNMGAQGLG